MELLVHTALVQYWLDTLEKKTYYTTWISWTMFHPDPNMYRIGQWLWMKPNTMQEEMTDKARKEAESIFNSELYKVLR